MRLSRREGRVSLVDDFGVVTPLGHVIGIGRNYAAHAKEMGGDPTDSPLVVFTKNPASVILSGEQIVIPPICQDRAQVDYEGEVAVILRSSIKDASEYEAMDSVACYTAANDVSARWWQKEGAGGQFCRGKSFDTFCPLGDEVIDARGVDPDAIKVTTVLNDCEMQRATTADLIRSIPRVLAELSRGTTLLAGTVVLTGTPSGVGAARDPQVFLRTSDRVEILVEAGSHVSRVKNEVR